MYRYIVLIILLNSGGGSVGRVGRTEKQIIVKSRTAPVMSLKKNNGAKRD